LRQASLEEIKAVPRLPAAVAETVFRFLHPAQGDLFDNAFRRDSEDDLDSIFDADADADDNPVDPDLLDGPLVAEAPEDAEEINGQSEDEFEFPDDEEWDEGEAAPGGGGRESSSESTDRTE